MINENIAMLKASLSVYSAVNAGG